MSPADTDLKVLSPEQHALLTAVLDRVVPARPELPGAGGLGVARSIDATLAATPELRRRFLNGLVHIQLAAARMQQADFTDLPGDTQDEVLRQVEREHPRFFAALVEHTYRGYYVLPQVHAVIGWDSRPPQPLGHTLPPFDPALLEKQRQRAPFWRKV